MIHKSFSVSTGLLSSLPRLDIRFWMYPPLPSCSPETSNRRNPGRCSKTRHRGPTFLYTEGLTVFVLIFQITPMPTTLQTGYFLYFLLSRIQTKNPWGPGPDPKSKLHPISYKTSFPREGLLGTQWHYHQNCEGMRCCGGISLTGSTVSKTSHLTNQALASSPGKHSSESV